MFRLYNAGCCQQFRLIRKFRQSGCLTWHYTCVLIYRPEAVSTALKHPPQRRAMGCLYSKAHNSVRYFFLSPTSSLNFTENYLYPSSFYITLCLLWINLNKLFPILFFTKIQSFSLRESASNEKMHLKSSVANRFLLNYALCQGRQRIILLGRKSSVKDPAISSLSNKSGNHKITLELDSFHLTCEKQRKKKNFYFLWISRSLLTVKSLFGFGFLTDPECVWLMDGNQMKEMQECNKATSFEKSSELGTGISELENPLL